MARKYLVGEVRADRTAEGGVLYELKPDSYTDKARPKTGDVLQIVKNPRKLTKTAE
jgi:hypothetical protein